MKAQVLWAGAATLVALAVAFVWNYFPTPREGGQINLVPPPVVVPLERATAAAVAASAPRSRPGAQVSIRSIPSFADQRDLWNFVKQAEASRDAAFQYEGYRAAGECRGLLDLDDFYTKRIDQTLQKGDQGPYQALAELKKRCAGFAAVSPAERTRLLIALKKNVAASNSSLAPMFAGRDLKSTEQRAVLRSTSPAAMELVLPRIQSKDAFATLLAMCDLGKACGPDSFGALLYCIDIGNCGQALWASASEEFSDEEWQQVQAERDRIVRAVKSGDLESLSFK